jgi:hypothetical protein
MSISTLRLTPLTLKILVISLLFHLLIQIPLNLIVPYEYYSELSMGDANAYFSISQKPFPEQPEFSPNKYRRILLPLTVYLFFSWNPYLGFLVINVVAVSVATMLFYLIACHYTDHPFELALIFAASPYLFASAHLGYTEPVMVMCLLAAYYALMLRDWVWQATLWCALAILAKEIAVFPVGALILIYTLKKGLRKSWPLALSALPVALYYLALGIHWGDLLFMVNPESDVERSNFGTSIGEIIRLIRSPESQPDVPPGFLIINQFLNLALFLFLAMTVYWLRKKRDLLLYTALSYLPLLFMGWAVISLNWHVGRQALIMPLCLLSLDQFMPQIKAYLGPLLLGFFAVSIFQSLYWAKFFLLN